MPIDIHTESLIPFRDVPAWCEQTIGRRVHISTVHRWRLRGVRGVKLPTILAGGERFTSREAIAGFFVDSTAAADGKPADATDPGRHKATEHAKSYLASEGF